MSSVGMTLDGSMKKLTTPDHYTALRIPRDILGCPSKLQCSTHHVLGGQHKGDDSPYVQSKTRAKTGLLDLYEFGRFSPTRAQKGMGTMQVI